MVEILVLVWICFFGMTCLLLKNTRKAAIPTEESKSVPPLAEAPMITAILLIVGAGVGELVGDVVVVEND